MHQTVDGRHGGQRIFEDPIPFGKHNVAGERDGFVLLTLGQEGEQHLRLLGAVLDDTSHNTAGDRK